MAWIRACGGGSPAVPDGKTVTPINDVTLWQQCAGIANPTYTMLAEILADVGVLSVLMASDNAVDYLVRCKTFANTICGNQTAMTYIGQNNYASNTLLDDSDWLDAILNSAYFESVLNVKVPEMTSSNTPSGRASASHDKTGHPAYYAFNSVSGYTWNSESGYGANSWLKYQFDNPVKVAKVYFSTYPTIYRSFQNYKIQGSNDDNTWVDLYSGSTDIPNKTEYVVNLERVGSYSYYRVLATSLYSGVNEVELPLVQFYGREDV